MITLMRIATFVFWINIVVVSITSIIMGIYNNSITNYEVVCLLILFICSLIYCICLFCEWHDRFLEQKLLRKIKEEYTEWWKLKKFGGWV
jgi:hypothetical protein